MNQGIFGHGFERRIAATGFGRRTQRAARSSLLALCTGLSLSCGRWRDSSPARVDSSSGGTSGSGATVSNSGATSHGGSSAANGGAGTAGEQPAQGGSSGAAARECGALIDDLEDGSGRICTGSGRVGVWYTFHDDDRTGSQWPAETPPGTPIETSLIPGGRGASQRAIHTTGSGFFTWGSGVGVDLNFDGTSYRLYDASAYQGIHFWARSGSGSSSRLRVRIGSASTTAVKYGGTCESGAPTECVGPSGTYLSLEPEWLEFTIPFTELDFSGQPKITAERDRLSNIQFMTEGTDFDFWIDDLSFVEGEPNCCSNLATCQGGPRFADAAVSSALLGRTDASSGLSCADVCSVRSASLAGPGFQSLSGFECLGALDILTLSETGVTDLSPLADLGRIHELSITETPLSSIGPLAKLSDLRQLTLNKDQIADDGPLAGLVKLQGLSMADNQLTDVTVLANLMALTTLTLSGNQIRDASPLSGLKQLTVLNLDNNQLSEVSELSSLSALSQLSLSHNQIKDASPLAALSLLEQLTLDNNQITSPLGALSGLAQLGSLDLSHNQLADLGSVFGLPALNSLELGDNLLTDVSQLASLSSLYSLFLEHNQISDPRALALLTQLSQLDLAYNAIVTLSGSFTFSNLRTLDLSNNGLSVIPEAALSGSALNVLSLAHNQLQDLSALAHVTFRSEPCDRCSASAKLDLSDNQVRDLGPLLGATWEKYQYPTLVASDNPIDCAAQAGNVQALRALQMSVDVCP